MQMYHGFRQVAPARLASGAALTENSPIVADPVEPFDETVAPRRRRQCYFCDVDKSDEWIFLSSLNRFVCKKCHDRINETATPKKEVRGVS